MRNSTQMDLSLHSIVMDEMKAAQLSALFNRPRLSRGDRLPPCWHWAMLPLIVDTDELGQDGHPEILLPDPSLRRWKRMWGGSHLTWHSAFMLGDALTYQRTFAGLEEREGKSGKVVVCSLRHRWATATGTDILDELQSIVYLPPKPQAASAILTAGLAQYGKMRFGPVELFRYSAATSNSHRIHYDYRYTTEVEGYPDLVVQGPLLATTLADWVEQARGVQLKEFSFRNVSPLFVNQGFECTILDDACEIRSATSTNVKATARFRDGPV